MKCCKQSQNSLENNENQGQQHNCGGGFKHMVMMLLCCLAPLGLVLLLRQSGYDGEANYLVLLLCPLMHLFMMRGMGHNHNEGSTKNNSTK
ncbi:Protein of unknown function [Sporomusa acidovorans]|nr:DUF2933 domain-containing protein [Sporomusa acidovorans]OZC18999.1 hypothetical protein SPACI_30850 [Sporomusa acidovorans DSM 3132]SDD72615.1 Protein of unknown function [Sporomusa acidovorans]